MGSFLHLIFLGFNFFHHYVFISSTADVALLCEVYFPFQSLCFHYSSPCFHLFFALITFVSFNSFGVWGWRSDFQSITVFQYTYISFLRFFILFLNKPTFLNFVNCLVLSIQLENEFRSPFSMLFLVFIMDFCLSLFTLVH